MIRNQLPTKIYSNVLTDPAQGPFHWNIFPPIFNFDVNLRDKSAPKGLVDLALSSNTPGHNTPSHLWFFVKLCIEIMGTHRVYQSKYHQRSGAILNLMFSWDPLFGYFAVFINLYCWWKKQNYQRGTHENAIQNDPRSSIFTVVNNMGTQSLHDKFHKNSSMGRLFVSGGIQTECKILKSFWSKKSITGGKSCSNKNLLICLVLKVLLKTLCYICI